MVIKALYSFLVFFFIVIVILLTQEPYILDLAKNDFKNPLVEFSNVKNFEINEQGIKTFAKASGAQRFSDRDILYQLEVYMQKNGTLETLVSNNATLKGEMVYLEGDVVYTRDNSSILRTQKAEYNQEKEILISKTPFETEDVKFTSNGKSFTYNAKTGKLEADDIKAVIKMEK